MGRVTRLCERKRCRSEQVGQEDAGNQRHCHDAAKGREWKPWPAVVRSAASHGITIGAGDVVIRGEMLRHHFQKTLRTDQRSQGAAPHPKLVRSAEDAAN
jgi:hypothetical protein